METPLENIFVVGPQVTGNSFFGRAKEIADLSDRLFSETPCNVSLIGPPHIGKSSLIKQVFSLTKEHHRRLRIQINMSNRDSEPYDFWYTLWRMLRSEIQAAGIWNDELTRHYKDLDDIGYGRPGWYTYAADPLEGIFREIQKRRFRVVIAIDQFDDVIRVFGNGRNYYSLLRSVISDWGGANAVLISKRRINVLEKQEPNLSNLYGVCKEIPLHAFSRRGAGDDHHESDMDAFYDALGLYGIHLSAPAKRRLEYYSGCLPYVCCMFGDYMYKKRKKLTNYDVADVESAFRECRPQIDVYYETLIKSLEEAGQLEPVFHLSIHKEVLRRFSSRHLEDMRYMGNLTDELIDGKTVSYAFSQDFMTYFRQKPLDLDAWRKMSEAENKLKKVFSVVFPDLSAVHFTDLKGADKSEITKRIDADYPELKLNWRQVVGYCENLSAHKENPSVLDVLTLSKVIDVIVGTWEDHFIHLFQGDSDWRSKLLLMKKLRNPMAHGQMDYINDDELSVCLHYCEELIKLPVSEDAV